MDSTSKSASTRTWLWAIEALAGFKEIDKSTLQVLINVAPVLPSDFDKKTRELVATKCLEGLFGSAGGMNSDASSSVDSRVGLDFSQSCEDVLRQLLLEMPLSNLKIAGGELLKWDVYTFIMQKRASFVKCELEQLKESVIEGTHPYAESLKERSGLALQNQNYQVLANDGKCNDLLGKDNENCTCAENMGEKDNPSSKKQLLGKNYSSSKRNRDFSVDEPAMQHRHEKQVGLEHDDFVRNAKKNKCYGIEAKKDKRVHPLGRDVSENSTERDPLIFEEGGHPKENVHVANTTVRPQHTIGNEPCQQQVESTTMNVALPGEIQLDISASDASTMMMPPHTSGDKRCQNTSLCETKDDNEHHIEPIPRNIDDPDKIQQNSYRSHSERNTENPSHSQQPVSSDGARIHAVDGSEVDHNEMIEFAAKKHEFMTSRNTSEQNSCMKCNEGGQLLVCKTTTCPLQIHERCLGNSGQFDENGNFSCPFCAYSHAVLEYLEAKKKASLAMKELSVFLGKGIEDQPTKLLEVHREENNHSIKRRSEHIDDKGSAIDRLPEARKEDNLEHVNDVNNLQFERSQQEAEPLAPCDNMLSSCGDKGIVNNGIDRVLIGEEETSGTMNPKNLSVRGLEENQVPADHVNNGIDRILIGEEEMSRMMNPKDSTVRGLDENQVPALHEEANFLSVGQNITGDDIEMREQCNTNQIEEPVCAHDNGEENISEDEKPIASRHTMRSRKRAHDNGEENISEDEKPIASRYTMRSRKIAHDNGEENISEDEKPITSRHTMRSRKCETQSKPQAIPQLRRRKIPWTAEEEEMLREGLQKFEVSEKIPWKRILEFGAHVFRKERTAVDLKDKWKNICKANSKSK